MDRAFVDTNIILDIYLKREPFLADAIKIFDLAFKSQVELCISSLSIMNAHYSCKKRMGIIDTPSFIRDLNQVLKVIELDNTIITEASKSNFKDFEDAVQHQTAFHCKAECIITRNTKDFEKSRIPIFTPEQFLNIYF